MSAIPLPALKLLASAEISVDHYFNFPTLLGLGWSVLCTTLFTILCI